MALIFRVSNFSRIPVFLNFVEIISQGAHVAQTVTVQIFAEKNFTNDSKFVKFTKLKTCKIYVLHVYVYPSVVRTHQ